MHEDNSGLQPSLQDSVKERLFKETRVTIDSRTFIDNSELVAPLFNLQIGDTVVYDAQEVKIVDKKVIESQDSYGDRRKYKALELAVEFPDGRKTRLVRAVGAPFPHPDNSMFYWTQEQLDRLRR
ncbi:MAG: hypothetical protein GF390_03630 [Candidatus Pacebacteria bacterium]|nr:hypothetical protein [Candidatus Paceibacterota bacterium]